jgi:ribokinase
MSGPHRTPPALHPTDRPRVVVLGDLTADVVLAPGRPLVRATDVPGRVAIRQGGSAANPARWLARLGLRSTLICAIGRDPMGRALVAALQADGVTVRAVRVAGARTGRIGILVTPDGERSFVADRGAAQLMRPEDVRPAWLDRAGAIHLPVYSLLGEPLGRAGLAAIRLGRAAGALVSVDLASAVPMLSDGRDAAFELLGRAAPDLLFATEGEAAALLGRRDPSGLLRVAPIVVVKRGAHGATVLAREGGLRFDVATRPIVATDTTGAGDAFDAGFLAAWLAARAAGSPAGVAFRQGAVGGNRAAARHLTATRPELVFG